MSVNEIAIREVYDKVTEINSLANDEMEEVIEQTACDNDFVSYLAIVAEARSNEPDDISQEAYEMLETFDADGDYTDILDKFEDYI